MYFLIREFYKKNKQERAFFFFFLLFPGYDLQYQIWVLQGLANHNANLADPDI